MPITLFITSHHKSRLGPDSSKTFDIHGGTIGRAPDNDWVLPDPERFVSSRHASIEYQRGNYFVTDTSKNGVYLNESTTPIGAGQPIELSDGDQLRVGEYDIRVAIEGAEEDLATSGAYEAGSDVVPSPTLTSAEAAVAREPEPQVEGELSLAEEEPSIVEPIPEANDDDWEFIDLPDETGTATREPARPKAAKPAPAAAAPPAVAPASAEDLQAFRALVEGLGLDPAVIPPGSGPVLMRLCGRLLRHAVEGLMQTLKARGTLKGEFRLPQTVIEPGDNNPLKFSAGVAEALRNLLVSREEAYLEPVAAMDAAFRDLEAHQEAVLFATRRAFDEILERFDPDDLREKFDRGLKRGSLLGATNKSKYWDLYCELYQVMTQHAEGNFQRLFGEEFVSAYQEEIERLTGRKLSRES